MNARIKMYILDFFKFIYYNCRLNVKSEGCNLKKNNSMANILIAHERRSTSDVTYNQTDMAEL